MRVRRNMVLLGVGAAAALVIAVAAASAQSTTQESAPPADQPAQIDRTFGTLGDDKDNSLAMDGGVGGAGEAGAAATTDETMGADGGVGGSGGDVSDRATRDDHTNIILYGPNGIPAESDGGESTGEPESPR